MNRHTFYILTVLDSGLGVGENVFCIIFSIFTLSKLRLWCSLSVIYHRVLPVAVICLGEVVAISGSMI